MTASSRSIAFWLGKPFPELLGQFSLADLEFTRHLEDALEPPVIYYRCPHHGVEVECDIEERVSSVFLTSCAEGLLGEEGIGVSFSWTREDVLSRLGQPTKSGAAVNDPALGRYGPWDRFTRDGHSIHIEYESDSDEVRMVTFMRADVVP